MGLATAADLNFREVFRGAPVARPLLGCSQRAAAVKQGALPRLVCDLLAEDAPPSSNLPGDEHCSDAAGLQASVSRKDGASVLAGPVAAPWPLCFFRDITSLLVFELVVQFMQFAA